MDALTFFLCAVSYLLFGVGASRLTMNTYWDLALDDKNKCLSTCDQCDHTPEDHVRHKTYAMIFLWAYRLPGLLVSGAVEKWLKDTEPTRAKIRRMERELEQEQERQKLPDREYPPGDKEIAQLIERIAAQSANPIFIDEPKPKRNPHKKGPFD